MESSIPSAQHHGGEHRDERDGIADGRRQQCPRAEAEIYRFPAIETKWLRSSRQRDSGRATSCKQSFELEWMERKSV